MKIEIYNLLILLNTWISTCSAEYRILSTIMVLLLLSGLLLTFALDMLTIFEMVKKVHEERIYTILGWIAIAYILIFSILYALKLCTILCLVLMLFVRYVFKVSKMLWYIASWTLSICWYISWKFIQSVAVIFVLLLLTLLCVYIIDIVMLIWEWLRGL